MPDFNLELACGGIVAGVDEAGRGPWAGPVVAAAVILPAALPAVLADGLDDSKKLSALRREIFCAELFACAEIGIGAASVCEIDRDNILAATFTAMCRAIRALARPPDSVLIDGNRLPPGIPCPGRTVVGGDGLSLSIAAASIVAKVTRDRAMKALAPRYPDFGWDSNAGYGTRQHQEGLRVAGVTPHHRRSFAPVAKILSPFDLGTPDIAITH
ncbi:MAG: ribonuclease HII [Rhodospirillaceae bacterium]